MAATLDITDPGFDASAQHGALDRFFLRFIRDERDLPFIYLSLKLSLIIFPMAIAMYIPGVFRWWMAPIYLLILEGWYVGPFILMLHNTSHRKLFKKQYRLGDRYIPWVLGPFFGETPETYFAHHIGMHHPENNLEDDLSSTMPYQRDSLLHFLTYFFRFLFAGILEMSMYFRRKNREKFLRRMLIGELSYYALAAALMFVNWQATLVVFVLPVLITRFGMMAGNWAQHAFVAPEAPENPFKNSLTCINSLYNRRCFNDGYHIGHHVRATRHWTEMPQDFLDNREEYHREGAIVFEGLDFFVVWALLMLKRHDYLASKQVWLGDEPRPPREELVAELKRRLRPIP